MPSDRKHNRLATRRHCQRDDHGADTRFAPSPRQQCSKQGLAVDRVRFGATAAPGHGDRGGVDDMAFHAVGFQQAVYPETVETRFLNGDYGNGVR
jgi:hypothetical protein